MESDLLPPTQQVGIHYRMGGEGLAKNLVNQMDLRRRSSIPACRVITFELRIEQSHRIRHRHQIERSPRSPVLIHGIDSDTRSGDNRTVPSLMYTALTQQNILYVRKNIRFFQPHILYVLKNIRFFQPHILYVVKNIRFFQH